MPSPELWAGHAGTRIHHTCRWRNSGRRRQQEVVHITSTLECDLGPHCERIELRARVAEVGGANLLGNVAVKEVEHQPNVAIGVPVQRQRLDPLPSARDAVCRSELIVEIDGAESAGNLPCAPAATGH